MALFIGPFSEDQGFTYVVTSIVVEESGSTNRIAFQNYILLQGGEGNSEFIVPIQGDKNGGKGGPGGGGQDQAKDNKQGGGGQADQKGGGGKENAQQGGQGEANDGQGEAHGGQGEAHGGKHGDNQDGGHGGAVGSN